ncbi:MAG: DMT family transporter [Planctomycetota bacterium]
MSRRTGILLLLLAGVMWSLSGIAVKLADAPPLWFAGLRSLGAALVLLPMALRNGGWPRGSVMGTCVVAHTVMVGTLIAAMTVGTAAQGILLQYVGPVVCALLGYALVGRTLRRNVRFGLIAAVVGVGVMVFADGVPSDFTPLLLGTASGLAYGSVIFLLERIDAVTDGPVDAFKIVLLNNAGSAAVLLPIAAGVDAMPGVAVTVFILGVGVVQMAIPYVLFQHGIRTVVPVAAALIVLIEPVLNPTLVWAFHGEAMTVGTIIGGTVLLFAAGLAATGREPATPPPAR